MRKGAGGLAPVKTDNPEGFVKIQSTGNAGSSPRCLSSGGTAVHRFFVNPSDISSCGVEITGDDVAHISKVLRLRCGDKISVCDQDGFDYICTVSEVGKERVFARVDEKLPSISESRVSVTLYQGLPKGDKMELIIQKCTELGVKRFVPVVMQRSVSRPKDASKKTARYRKIALEAAKQSKRSAVPYVCDATDFASVLDRIKDGDALNILPYENEKSTTLKEVLRKNCDAKNINLIIGPEGGFSDEEIADALAQNIQTVTLGPRILRCETAPIAAVAAIMYELGDCLDSPLEERK